MRFSALRYCIQRLSSRNSLFPEGYRFACAYLDNHFGFGPNTTPTDPTETQLLDALNFLEVSRNRYLERLRAFEKKRIREKARGKRYPNRADILALKAINRP